METRDCEMVDVRHSKVVPPQSFDELVSQLREVFQDNDVDIDYVKALMSSYKSKRSEWKKYAKFDVNRYTRNLVDVGNGKYNLILLCWNESQGSGIHSHAESHCFMTVLEGSLRETLFEWPNESQPDSEMTLIGENAYSVGETAYINDDLGLHRVENLSHSDKAVSLHLYCPPFDECKCFDQRTGHGNTSKVTFFTKFGKRTPFGKDLSKLEAENN